MSILNFVNHMNKYDINNFKKFFIEDQVIGYIHNDNVKYFKEYSEVFIVDESKISLSKKLDTKEKRTYRVAEVLKVLNEKGLIKGWRDEYYDVSESYGNEVLMQIERSAADIFGIKKYGVHGNAYCIIDDELYVWVAKRSMQKTTYPGKYDQLIAGGFTGGGYTPSEIFVKEAGEEAGINSDLAKTAKSVGCVSYTRSKKSNSIARGNIFVFDIYVAEDYALEAVDGEVEEFFLMKATDLLDVIINEPEKIKDNCILIMIDFFIRHGVIKSDHPDYVALCKNLHQ